MAAGDATARAQMQAVFAAATPWWAGEAEVVRTYLARGRTRAGDLAWLRAQTAKESQDLRDLPAPLRAAAAREGRLDAHPDGAAGLARFAVELAHARLLAALVTELSGAPVDLLALAPLPEDQRLYDLRRALRVPGDALAAAAVDFTEGGGGAMYTVLAGLDGDALDRRIAAAFATIARDELAHGPLQIHAIARAARTPADWARAVAIVRDIGRQRLRMRNEMFGHPLAAARLAAIDAGQIAPWPVPIPL